MHVVPLDRPPRPPTGAITGRVRRAILRHADRLNISATGLVALHGQAEHIGSHVDLLADVEERYGMATRHLASQVQGCIDDVAATGGPVSPVAQRDIDAQCVLFVLPDAEFLTVLEHAVDLGYREQRFTEDMCVELLKAADGALQAHGAPYRRDPEAPAQFAWVGDPKQDELTVQPALLALADPRLAGAQGEFEEALRKRRGGTPKDLEDAIDEAAKSVESILQILHHELGVALPTRRQLSSLFSNLIEKGPAGRIPPGYVDHLVLAAGGPRNLTSHGQGATVREVPDELADASIAAAATAITLLAHYLP
jgi:hypothetical protein